MSADVRAVRTLLVDAETKLRWAEQELEEDVDHEHLGQVYLKIGNILTLLSDADDLLGLAQQEEAGHGA